MKVSLGNKAKSSSEGKTERGGPRLILVPGKSKRPDWEFKVILSYKREFEFPSNPRTKEKKKSVPGLQVELLFEVLTQHRRSDFGFLESKVFPFPVLVVRALISVHPRD